MSWIEGGLTPYIGARSKAIKLGKTIDAYPPLNLSQAAWEADAGNPR
jgi:hypothetical protein